MNGNILLEVPDATDADVSATTVSGSIVSDFPLTIEDGFVAITATGTLGQGGPELALATVNGDIALRRR